MFLLPKPLLYIIEIDEPNGWWEATDPACAFRLLPSARGLPKGWICLTVPMQVPCDTHALPVFQVDSGNGFQPIPVILPRRALDGCWTFVMHVPANAVAMSLSPVNRLGPLRLGPLEARPISRSALVARLGLSLATRWLRDPPSMLRAGRDMAAAWRIDGWAGLRAAVADERETRLELAKGGIRRTTAASVTPPRADGDSPGSPSSSTWSSDEPTSPTLRTSTLRTA